MSKLAFSSILIIVILMSACSSEKNYLMKRVRPAAYTFHPSINNILLVNDTYLTDSIRYLDNRSLQDDQSEIFATCLNELIHLNLFDSIHSIKLKHQKSFSNTIDTYYPQADLSVILSNYQLNSFKSNQLNSSTAFTIATIDLYIHDHNKSAYSRQFMIRDTVYSSLFDHIVDPQNIYLYMIEQLRVNLTHKLIATLLPHQSEDNRTLFSWTDPNMKDARRYFSKGNTQYAQIIWQELLKYETKSIRRAYLLCNLSFIAENNNQLDQALELIQLSKQSLDAKEQTKRAHFVLYLNSIEQSITEKKNDQILLKQQLRL